MELEEAAASSQDAASFLQGALLRRLRDDDWEVLDACLQGKTITTLPPSEVLPLLVRVVDAGPAAQDARKGAAAHVPLKVAARVGPSLLLCPHPHKLRSPKRLKHCHRAGPSPTPPHSNLAA